MSTLDRSRYLLPTCYSCLKKKKKKNQREERERKQLAGFVVLSLSLLLTVTVTSAPRLPIFPGLLVFCSCEFSFSRATHHLYKSSFQNYTPSFLTSFLSRTTHHLFLQISFLQLHTIFSCKFCFTALTIFIKFIFG